MPYFKGKQPYKISAQIQVLATGTWRIVEQADRKLASSEIWLYFIQLFHLHHVIHLFHFIFFQSQNYL
jgi:hypothetical protein